MAIVDFPSEFPLKRSALINATDNIAVDYLDDGTPLLRATGTASYVTIPCEFVNLFESELDVLIAFLSTNRANQIAWTIDGIDYLGVIDGGWSYDQNGNVYNVRFRYYAQRQS